MIRYPPPEGPGETVQNAIHLDGHHQGSPSENDDYFVHVVRDRHGVKLGRDHQADAQAPMVGEPLQGVADGSAVDYASAYAAQGVPEVKATEGFGVSRT